MGARRRARTGRGEGELISALNQPRRARVAVGLTAVALAIASGALVATDARAAAALAWSGTAISVVLLTAGLVAASPPAVQSSVAVLGVLLLLRHEARLVIAPLYGACLLLVAELAQRSLELRGLARVGPRVISARVAAVLALAALGACGGAAAAIAVTIAPRRSVWLTAIGTVAILAAFAAIVLLARRHGRENPGKAGQPGTDPPATSGRQP